MADLFVLACSSPKDKPSERKLRYCELESQNLQGDISAIRDFKCQCGSGQNYYHHYKIYIRFS